jgi:hypothetical protein
MRVFLLFFLLYLNLSLKAQVTHHDPPCGGMDIYEVGIHIKGYKVLDTQGISYSEISADSLKNGFSLALTDSSYKLKWFRIYYSQGEKVSEYPITGFSVNLKNANFLKKIKAGDLISLDCINIKKEGIFSLSTGFYIIVTE